MGKKKGKKKQNTVKDFTEMLENNQKKIIVKKGDETQTLSEATEESIEAITCVPSDGIIPVSSEEAVKYQTNEDGLNIHYAKAPFILYEYTMKYPTIPQTLVMTMTENEVEDLFDYDINQTITTLMERTNTGLIIKGMKKAKTKIKNWLKKEVEEDLEMFVLNIPNVVLFTNSITRKELSRTERFNLCIQVIKTPTKLKKLKKKDEEKFKEITQKIVDMTAQNAISLGNSYIHMELNEDYMTSCKEYISYMLENFTDTKDKNQLINLFVFTTTDTNLLVEASNVIFKKVIE